MSLKVRRKRNKKRIRNVRIYIGEVVALTIHDGARSIRSRIVVKNATLTPVQDYDWIRHPLPLPLMPPRELRIELDCVMAVNGERIYITHGG